MIRGKLISGTQALVKQQSFVLPRAKQVRQEYTNNNSNPKFLKPTTLLPHILKVSKFLAKLRIGSPVKETQRVLSVSQEPLATRNGIKDAHTIDSGVKRPNSSVRTSRNMRAAAVSSGGVGQKGRNKRSKSVVQQILYFARRRSTAGARARSRRGDNSTQDLVNDNILPI